MTMAKLIKIGEKVVGRIMGASGRYGTRQVVGTVISLYPEKEVRDKNGSVYICSQVRRL